MRDVVSFPKTGLPPLTISQWRDRQLPQPDFILGNFLTTTSRMIIAAPTGLGKINFVMAVGMSVAAGQPFLHWVGRRACNVLYVDGEMSRRLLKRRISEAAERIGEEPVAPQMSANDPKRTS
jgi:RecA-family ATPase